MENKTFDYNYSAKEHKEIENIRNRYISREENKMETLKRLDRRARNAGIIESLCLGIIGALVFGVGMCFFLDVFAGATWIAVALFAAGALLMLPAYPMKKYISRKVKDKLSPEILRLSDELLRS